MYRYNVIFTSVITIPTRHDVRKVRWGFRGSTFMWNNHTRGGIEKRKSAAATRRFFCNTVSIRTFGPRCIKCVCTPITPRWIKYYYYYILRTTKFDESATEPMPPEANFAKRTHIMILYYMISVHTALYSQIVCACVWVSITRRQVCYTYSMPR